MSPEPVASLFDFDILKLTLLKSGRAITDTLAFDLALHPHGPLA
jgi:hypothetical protein